MRRRLSTAALLFGGPASLVCVGFAGFAFAQPPDRIHETLSAAAVRLAAKADGLYGEGNRISQRALEASVTEQGTVVRHLQEWDQLWEAVDEVFGDFHPESSRDALVEAFVKIYVSCMEVVDEGQNFAAVSREPQFLEVSKSAIEILAMIKPEIVGDSATPMTHREGRRDLSPLSPVDYVSLMQAFSPLQPMMRDKVSPETFSSLTDAQTEEIFRPLLAAWQTQRLRMGVAFRGPSRLALADFARVEPALIHIEILSMYATIRSGNHRWLELMKKSIDAQLVNARAQHSMLEQLARGSKGGPKN